MKNLNLYLFILFLLSQISANAQTTVTGRVTDASTGDPVPFANVVFQGTTVGTTTDFDGRFSIKISENVDSVYASYIGYKTKYKTIRAGENQTINFQLEEDIKTLDEIVVYPGENPAFPIMRKVIENKNRHDYRNLDSYEYDAYTKIEIDIDNLSEKFRDRRLVKKVSAVLDSIDRIAGEDGKPILPIFISESLSKFYYNSKPVLRKEKILHTKITGVGIEDGSLTSQVIGSSFQQYNFYQNWLNILEKDFVSPIADGWRIYYEYDLVDSVYIGDYYCYRLDLFPKRSQDLAFYGSIWIDKETYALKQVDLQVKKSANLNFVEKLKIQQELGKVETGHWIPTKSRVLVDVGQLSNNSAGFLAKFYVSNENLQVNKEYDISLFNIPLEVDPNAQNNDDEFWNINRHDPLSPTEQNVVRMIDTLKHIPAVKRIADVLDIISSGYVEIGKFDIGPYPLFFASNNVEGIRLRLGGRTNEKFSRKVVFSGYLAYGFDDEEFKYSGQVDWILNRTPWTQMSFSYRRDIDQVGLTQDDLPGFILFEAFARNRTHEAPYFSEQFKFSFNRELIRGLQQTIEFRQTDYNPLFPFEFFTNPEATDSPTQSQFSTSEIVVNARLGRDEIIVINDNERISLGALRKPIYRLNYVAGLNNVLGSDFDYHKLNVGLDKKIRFGPLGTSNTSLDVGYIFGQVPFPLLKGHIGNESNFYVPIAFNLMELFEFVSDQYASVRYSHSFEGFILNRVPLIRKLKWRLVGNANVLFGDVRDENFDILSSETSAGLETLTFSALDPATPYVELGYGIENIFKVFRVDFFHRVTYTSVPDIDTFGVKFSLQLTL
ncbi:MAG: DUF5686 family protein [Bacteroidota bacterium]